MRALAYDRYGSADVLTLRDVETPRVGPKDVLVRVAAAALNPKDSLVRKGRFAILSGRRFPKYVGVDFAGEVVETGGAVTTIKRGDRVFGALEEIRYGRGSVAEYVLAKENEVALAPPSLGDELAATIPLAALTSLQSLRDLLHVKGGDRVLVHGASGGVGTFAIQLAKSMGATVTTTSSARNLELCRSLGADEALDYATTSPLDKRQYEAVFDAFGNLSFNGVRPSLSAHGAYVTTVPSKAIFIAMAKTAFGPQRARIVVVRSRRADLEHLAALVSRGELRPVVEQRFDFEHAIDAVRALETKRTRGKIAIRVAR
jgi:NADPH:quinone reductase-like Zn-dependent oxidoreductase